MARCETVMWTTAGLANITLTGTPKSKRDASLHSAARLSRRGINPPRGSDTPDGTETRAVGTRPWRTASARGVLEAGQRFRACFARDAGIAHMTFPLSTPMQEVLQ